MTRIVLLASVSVALFACRGGGDDMPGDDDPGMDGGSNAGEVTIQEVQNDAMPVGTQVELRGVVVTAIDTYGDRTGDLFVGEPEGGPFSGVKVYGAPLDVLANLQVGDVVDITNAEKHEACTESAPCGPVVFENGHSLTEVQGISVGALTITKTSSGATVTPTPVDALAISMMADQAARDAEWEKWEGVLITVQNARQINAYGPLSANNNGPDQQEFLATGGVRVQSVLADLGSPVVGTCYEGITGLGDYFFNYLVLPRSASELVGGGTGCAAVTTATIAQVQAGTATGAVVIEDVYVTAIAFNNRDLYVSSSLTAAEGEGLFVRSAQVVPDGVEIGAKVTVHGNATEFNNDTMGSTLTQINSATITDIEAPTVAPTPLTGVSIATLNDETTGEPYEGVLITLENVKVTTLGTGPDFISTMTAAGGATFKADDTLYRLVAADVQNGSDPICYATMTGIWTYQPFADTFVFLPRKSATAMAPDATVAASPAACN